MPSYDEALTMFHITQENAEKFVSLPIYTMTTDNIANLEQQIKNLIANKVVWEVTNEEQLFLATLKQSTKSSFSISSFSGMFSNKKF